jgi:hypothetical protein
MGKSVTRMAGMMNRAISQLVGGTITNFASTIGKAIGGAENAFASFGKTAKKAIANFMQDVGKKMITMATQMEIFQKLLASQPALAIGAGVALVAAGKALEQSIQEGPKLAEGGIVNEETLAVVGDNKNVKSDPEVVSPLSKLKGMMADQVVQVQGTLRGDGEDLFAVIENQKRVDRNI